MPFTRITLQKQGTLTHKMCVSRPQDYGTYTDIVFRIPPHPVNEIASVTVNKMEFELNALSHSLTGNPIEVLSVIYYTEPPVDEQVDQYPIT